MTRRPWVKVCGLTRAADAAAAVAAGANAVGVILVPQSPRAVTPEAARAVLEGLPPGIARVGVVADAPVEAVRAWVAAAGLTAVQAHGSEPPEACRAYGVPVVKAFPAGPGFDPSRLEPYREFPVLLDGQAEGAGGDRPPGGLGRGPPGRGPRIPGAPGRGARTGDPPGGGGAGGPGGGGSEQRRGDGAGPEGSRLCGGRSGACRAGAAGGSDMALVTAPTAAAISAISGDSSCRRP